MAARGILRANRAGFLAKGKGVPANRVWQCCRTR